MVVAAAPAASCAHSGAVLPRTEETADDAAEVEAAAAPPVAGPPALPALPAEEAVLPTPAAPPAPDAPPEPLPPLPTPPPPPSPPPAAGRVAVASDMSFDRSADANSARGCGTADRRWARSPSVPNSEEPDAPEPSRRRANSSAFLLDDRRGTIHLSVRALVGYGFVVDPVRTARLPIMPRAPRVFPWP